MTQTSDAIGNKTIFQFFDQYLLKTDKFLQERAKYERIEEKAHAKLMELRHPSWVDLIIVPIAKELAKRYPDRTYEILGPFGIGARVSIHFYRNGIENPDRWINNNCISITFEPGAFKDRQMYIIDYSKNSGKYAKGTIGELNGFNYAEVEIPVDATIDWIAQWVK